MPEVVLGVCGGIAAYKACELLRLFTASGHGVPVVPGEAPDDQSDEEHLLHGHGIRTLVTARANRGSARAGSRWRP